MSERCPICRKPASPDARPFCSSRCADIDLGRWLTEQYTVAGTDGDAGHTGGFDKDDEAS
jgi:endogenous inhibitor of DNA gyrase (YacG/DUF329 family)